MPDRLQQLLLDAHRATPAPPSPQIEKIINGIIARNQRRVTAVPISCAAGAVLLLTLALIPIVRTAREQAGPARPQQMARQTEPPAHRIQAGPDQELARLRRQVQVHEQRLAGLLNAERLEATRLRLVHLASLPTEQTVAERAADALLQQADRWALAHPEDALAADAYRRMIRAFPDTAAAEVARRRLADENRKEG